jgi:excisionase family DNA binding protein
MSSNTIPIPPTITVHQAAHVLQVQPATVYNWIRADEFPHIHLGGRIRIPTAKLADLLGISSREVVEGLDQTSSPTDRSTI